MASTSLMKRGGKTKGIHIKPSHKGRFTSWCEKHGYNGVTAECKSASKRSDNMSVRKQATFADNAGKWK